MLDLLASSALLLVGIPLWLLLAALVKTTSPGPILYRQVRIGRGGRPFTMLKFRTMRSGAESETGPVWARRGDPRLTPAGRWLRRLRLDEIPQLINVIRGEMSLVGPRPERPPFVEEFTQAIPGYAARHSVRPGLTGLAQVSWRYDASIEDVRKKLEYDLYYTRNRTLPLDLKILGLTLLKALRADGH